MIFMMMIIFIVVLLVFGVFIFKMIVIKGFIQKMVYEIVSFCIFYGLGDNVLVIFQNEQFGLVFQ